MNPTITGRVGSTRAAIATKLLRIASVLATAFVLSSAAYAQVLYGTITGNVTDQTGAVLPGTTVQVVNTATGVAKTAVTDARGVFLFSDLIPGAYDVSFDLS